jgi:hypothetical protein
MLVRGNNLMLEGKMCTGPKVRWEKMIDSLTAMDDKFI